MRIVVSVRVPSAWTSYVPNILMIGFVIALAMSISLDLKKPLRIYNSLADQVWRSLLFPYLDNE